MINSLEDFNYLDYLDFFKISRNLILSENFIRKFQDKVDWINISYYQTLSENFIREFQDKVYWINISCYQKLSENFIREFQSKINWIYIRWNEKLQVSDKFCEDFDEKLCYNNVWLINGKLHRTLGPAIGNEFWYRGEKIEVSNIEQYKYWLKLRIFS
jgi:hypothetical protein